MKKISLTSLMGVLLLIALLVLPVSAINVVLEKNYIEYEDQTQSQEVVYKSMAASYMNVNYPLDFLSVREIENVDQISYISLRIKDANSPIPEGRSEIGYVVKNSAGTIVKSGDVVIYKTYIRNLVGTITHSEFLIFFQNWDNQGLTGRHTIVFSQPFTMTVTEWTYTAANTGSSNICVAAWKPDSSNFIYLPRGAGKIYEWSITVVSASTWESDLLVSTNPDSPTTHYDIALSRFSNPATFTVYGENEALYTDASGNDVFIQVLQDRVKNITLVSPTRTYIETIASDAPGDPIDPGTPDNTGVTIYIRNSQTNALLANAHINISASVNGNFHEVANETVPSGIYSIDLQPTGGGMPNPDFYRLIVTAEGYNSIMPYIDFEFDEAATIYAYLDPIGGAPEDENNTFIDFYVRDMSANPISGATVNFGGYTLITNSAGYTIFEVDKNKTYSWTVSKSGYGSLTGNAVIGGNARHTINTVLAPAVTPTIPTAIPTSTPISPTPTMTAPTGEPVSNWLEWFAAHFGMMLGGGAEIGKIFMWLCFSVPVGVYVGKEAKAGAAGFMAGAGVVTIFFVLIGWVPIWLLVFIALIIGLLYAKVFNNSDTGGGR